MRDERRGQEMNPAAAPPPPRDEAPAPPPPPRRTTIETAEDRAIAYARELGRLRQLLATVKDELHHKHDGDLCFACYLEGEIDKAIGSESDG